MPRRPSGRGAAAGPPGRRDAPPASRSFRRKNLGAFGDGGLVATADAGLARTLRRLRNHGAEPGPDTKYLHELLGGNFRLDALQAAVLRVKARHLEGWTARRRRHAAAYRRLIADAGLDSLITLPVEPPESVHVYNQFVIRAPNRDELRRFLAARGIGSEIYYPVPLHLQKCFEPLGWRPGSLPNAEQAAGEVLALPIYRELTDTHLSRVVDAIAEFAGASLDRSPGGS